MTVVRYDASKGPSGGPTRGAIALRDHWREVTGLGDLGIYNPRKVRGSRTTWSTHASGRAVDFAANAHDPSQAAKAEHYIQFLIRHSTSFQVQYLIWDRKCWRSGQGWRNYQGTSPHTDHVHVELNIDGGQNLTLQKLRTQWARDHAPQEEAVTDDDVERIARRVQQLLLVEDTAWLDWRIEGLRDRIRKHSTTMRDSLAKLIRNPDA